jgi:hypothetical protein
MSHHFTAQDIGGTIAAFVLFGLLLVIPGYVAGSAFSVFSFARRTLAARIAISVCLSIATVPIMTYLCWLAMPSAPWLACAGTWVAFPVVLIRGSGPKNRRLSKQRIAVLAILAGWVVIGTACLIDIQIGNRLYVPVTSFDYMLRTAITAAVERTGVPPANPYFHAGHGYILRYHYYWYMLCGLVGRIGRPLVSARLAVIAGTLWSGIALVAIVALYTHLSAGTKTGSADRRTLIAVSLLSVTGLDIVPLAITFLLSGRFNASSEWWNEPVLSWVNSVFWQPHSIAALVACVTGLLAIREAVRHESWRARFPYAAIGGAALASALGLSIYVSFVFVVFLIAWMVTLLVRGRRLESGVICVTSGVALVMAVPYLLDLTREVPVAGSGSGSVTLPIQFAIRSFYFAEALAGPGPSWQTTLANTLALPLNYFLEFGFFFMVGIKQWKRGGDACGTALLITSLVVCTFLRSNSISNNDLGWRGIVFAQFVLLIWATELWDNGLFLSRRSMFSAVGVMLALGFAATLYDVTMLRIYPILLDDFSIPRYHWLAPDHHLGERTYALREVYERLGRELPENAIIQQNPDAVPGDLFYGLYADRQTAVETPSCGAIFGGPAALCVSVVAPVREVFDSDAHVDQICRELSISAVIAKDTDTVWANRDSWVWRREPLVGNNYARAFLCGGGTAITSTISTSAISP